MLVRALERDQLRREAQGVESSAPSTDGIVVNEEQNYVTTAKQERKSV